MSWRRIENSASQSKMINAGHMKKFVHPGTEKGGRETAPSVQPTHSRKELLPFQNLWAY